MASRALFGAGAVVARQAQSTAPPMRLRPEPLLSAEAIAARVAALGAELSAAYAGRKLLVLAVMKGSVIFAADLLRFLGEGASLDFIRAKSYAGTDSEGTVSFTHLPETPLTGAHVLVVEDILDTGRTAQAIMRRISEARPASLALCTLLDKPARRVVQIEAEYVGFDIEDHFVVGYGLDYDERYRALPCVHVLEPAADD